MLPNVYDPKDRPWVKPENASTEALQNQVDHCPSGALTYYMNDSKVEKSEDNSTNNIQVKVINNGPLMVFGDLEVTDKDGNAKLCVKSTAFCRCGASDNKPYCDGTHKKIDFIG